MRSTSRRQALIAIAATGVAGLVGPPAMAAVEVESVARLADLGTTRRLEILPLVEWFASSPELRVEPGVSYLVRTDGGTVLFDVGGNPRGESPSPLEANMQRLGVRLKDIDTIVISHRHMDHVGGLRFARLGTFSLGNEQVDLAAKRVVVPSSMTYPGVRPLVTLTPTVLSPGVATTGPMTTLLPIGPVDEQALVVRVQGKGIVLIVGCGHQGLTRLIARVGQLIDEPLYGVIGGLHYPVPSGRIVAGGVDLQRQATYGNAAGPSPTDVQREVELLRARQPQWVSVSPHDSSDEMIELFRKAFGAQYHDLRAGELQVIGAAGDGPARSAG